MPDFENLHYETKNHIAYIKILAQQRAGKILAEMKEAGARADAGDHTYLPEQSTPKPTLAELGPPLHSSPIESDLTRLSSS